MLLTIFVALGLCIIESLVIVIGFRRRLDFGKE